MTKIEKIINIAALIPAIDYWMNKEEIDQQFLAMTLGWA